jgi:hypothetical protein
MKNAWKNGKTAGKFSGCLISLVARRRTHEHRPRRERAFREFGLPQQIEAKQVSMANNRKIRLVLVCSGLVAGVLAFIAVVEVNAQNQTIEDLAQRLKQKGVPVKSATALSRIPFQIEIVLQSSSNGKELTPDDLWYTQLARRETALAHRIGINIANYKLTLLNTKGETINWEKNTLFPNEPSQRAVLLTPSRLSDEATAKLTKEQLDLRGMSLEMLDVFSNTTTGDNGQNLIIHLSVPDLMTANKVLLPFLSSLRPFLDNINTKYGTRIVLCWFRLVDRKGNLLLNYVWDVETREETSLSTPGLIEWYPRPSAPSTIPYPGP